MYLMNSVYLCMFLGYRAFGDQHQCLDGLVTEVTYYVS